MPNARPVAILGGVRIPFCRQNTAYSDVGNLGMSVRTLGALVERFGLHGQQLGEVAMGAVIKHSSDWNLGREATLSSGLSPLTPGITLQRACGTSLDSIVHIGNKIAAGQIEVGIGGGSDTTSDVPIVYGQSLRRRLLEAARDLGRLRGAGGRVMRASAAQSGISLIEVLVAIFVLAIGMLGMAALQMASLRSNQSSYERSAAVMAAYTMIDRLRADVTAARAGSYNLALDDDCASPGGTTFPEIQLAAWLADLRTSMGPSACGGVTCSAGAAASCVISVRWDDSRVQGGLSNQTFSIEARL